MRVDCPQCESKVVVEDPDRGERVRCLKCGHKFAPPAPKAERRPSRDRDDDDDRDRDRPRRREPDYAERPRSPSRRDNRDNEEDDRDREDDSEEKKSPAVLIAVLGIGLVGLIGVIIGVVLLASPDKDKKETAENKPAETKAANPVPAPSSSGPAPAPLPKKDPPNNTPPKSSPPSTTPSTSPPPTTAPSTNPKTPDTGEKPAAKGVLDNVGPYAKLFSQPADNLPPPSIQGAKLTPVSGDIEPEIPTFYSLMMARKEAKVPNSSTIPPKGAKLTLDELKKACAFIKVDAGEQSSSGSGFLIGANGATGLVATNHHVVEAAVKSQFGAPATITVVFNSGQSDEHQHKGTIVAFDPLADLAILKVQSNIAWPKAINPFHSPPKLTEGIAIQFWGFPLGSILARGNKNPEITLGTGNISSFRHNDAGKLDRVQISGTMNPGNSGGPIVDADGRLVGIAVAIINPALGTGIGFAVPVNDLIALIEGKLLATIFVPDGVENGKAKFLAISPYQDPFDRIDTIFVRRWSGEGTTPEVVKDPNTGYKPFGLRKDGKGILPGIEDFPLKKLVDREEPGGLAVGDISVPLDAEKVVIQLGSGTVPNPQTGQRYTVTSKPVEYTMKVADQPMGTDTRPMSDLVSRIDTMAGRTIVVKGRIMAPPNTREAIQDVLIADTNGKVPDRIKFLVNRDMANQFDEVEREQRPMPVRLVCLVGERGTNGILPVRITRLDFIGRSDRIVRTIPAAPAAADEDLGNINRDPEKFAGRTVVVKAGAVPFLKSAAPDEFTIVFQNQVQPRNLSFKISKTLRERLIDKLGDNIRANMTLRVRVTGVIPDRPAPAGAKTMVTLTKIELMGRDGRVTNTVE